MTVNVSDTYIQMAKLHFISAAIVGTTDSKGQYLSLGEVIREELLLHQPFIVYWTLLSCIPVKQTEGSLDIHRSYSQYGN